MEKKIRYALAGMGITAIGLTTYFFWKKSNKVILKWKKQEPVKILALPVISTASVKKSAREYVERRRQRLKDRRASETAEQNV